MTKKINKKYLKEFEEAMNYDLNTPQALQVLWKLIRDEKAEGKLKTIKEIDKVFGLDLLKKEELKISKEVQELVAQREKAREEKNFKLSDDIRDKIKQKGFEVQDTKQGPVLEKA